MTGLTGAAKPAGRIGLLDAYRTLAIIWVAIYHYAWFWSSARDAEAFTVPYDDAMAWIPLAEVGYLGVTLFFLISGYVIALTLQSTATFSDFAIKRFARLWPTLMLCGALTFAVATLFGPEELRVSVPEALISMTLIPPVHAGKLVGATDWNWLDGAYWSLWVEVRFYVIIGAIFYMFRKRWLEVWLGFEALGWLVSVAMMATGHGGLQLIDGLLFGEYVPYFTLGILACRKMRGLDSGLDKYAAIFAGLHAAFWIAAEISGSGYVVSLLVGYAVVFGLFGIFVWRPRALAMLETKHMLSIGRASYSFYLLHQVVGISLMVLIAKYLGGNASLVAIPYVIGLLLVASHYIFHYVEQPANRWIVGKFVHARKARKAAATDNSATA